MKNAIIVHYHTSHGNYSHKSLWSWREGQLGRDTFFTRYDSFGAVASLEFSSEEAIFQVSMIIKEPQWKNKSHEYSCHRDYGFGKTEIWLVDGDETVYYSRQAAVSSSSYFVRRNHAFDMAINSSAFDKKWGFSGWLGFQYDKEKTCFRLWAPTAEAVSLILFDSTDNKASVAHVIAMEKGRVASPEDHTINTIGVWEVTVHRDLNFQSYHYRVNYRKRTYSDTRDPYAIATTADGKRSIVVDPNDLKPKHFKVKHKEEANWRLDNPNQAVIYEMHVRDFSKSETSGVDLAHRGKFMGLIQEGTQNKYGDATCFDYVKSLGITHIQLQPIFDHHQTIDETGDFAYNWGYDPENYNVPSAIFTSNPHEPTRRILELKEVIQAYHDAGINVIMDVVYNHTYSNMDSAFQLAVPDYYYRMNPDGSFQNGSGCGNETASEKEMFRKYMLDSILYWIQEYNIDGFRFDLMGLHDVETMSIIRQEVDKIDSRILLYGEGWDMGIGLQPEKKAKKDNAHLLPGIGFFNDDQRNAVKGSEVYGNLKAGFISDEPTEATLAKAILGSDELGTYLSPSQVVNYVEAHDNYNLNDLFWALHPQDSLATHTKRIQLSTAMNLLMQGIAFMQIGQEFLRTKCLATGENGIFTSEDKQRAMNSYNAPDAVNQIDWNQVTFEKRTIRFIQKIIALKTSTPYFSYSSFEEIRKHLYIENAHPHSGFITYFVDDGKKIQIIFTIHRKKLKLASENAIIESNDESFYRDEEHINNLTAIILDVTK
ncbi:type I pullulanase [Streptococcus iniae]|uniref:type I pullulanase n=1 Tax=Streptococcus iniae TaxID=1346 RepID=UPI000EF72511|nr:type I pullulanase [Streptococcus iniae]RLU28492.1 type I pullulanase [Streptococcus iniae]RLU31190.1 type I pullulanase [Streptococcus iniae]RLV32983.1 type I pullulanase [Streptococcus iniae]